jgi:2-alkenal reductase
MKRYFGWFLFAIVVLVPLVACQTISSAVTLTTAPPIATPRIFTPESPQQSLSASVPDLVSQQDRLVNLYEQVSPGVVAIRVLTQDGEALGSGFVYDTKGHILTNYHVVEGETEVEVDFPSGLKVRGNITGTDLDSDLAVILINVPASELHPLTLGDSNQVKVGQTVVAIGNPFGLSGTMTNGIVSAVGRTLQSMHESPSGGNYTAGDIIQTDTAINPGNSGGPLINLNGEVIGINRAIRTENFSTSGEPVNSGIGFAVPINIIKKVTPFLIEKGKYDYPYLGISSTAEISLLVQEALGLPRSTGAYVSEITPGSPADKAGLLAGTDPSSIPNLMAGGDLIIAVDGHEILTFGDLLSYVINYKSPGDTVKLLIIRNNQEMEVNLTLGSRP